MNVPGIQVDWANTGNGRGSSRGRWTCHLGVTLLLGMLTLATGCTRSFFREWADREVGMVLDEKNVFADWYVQDVNVYPNRIARYYDPTSPDRPPMPPDDPAAWLLSTHPQKPRDVARVEGTGYVELLATWSAENRAELRRKKELNDLAMALHRQSLGLPRGARIGGGTAEASQPRAVRLEKPVASSAVQLAAFQQPNDDVGDPLPPPTKANPPKDSGHETPAQHKFQRYPAYLYPEEPYLINVEQAVELGVLNSREYQDRREDLYVAALPVTSERFSFLPQFLLTQNALRRWSGDESSVGPNNDWNVTTTGGVTQQFFTGALLTAQLVNRTAINLTGNQKHTESVSQLSLDLFQPLLRGGGRAVALEGLTQSERNFVYAIRGYARFQRAFVVSVIAGVSLDVEFSAGGRTISAGLTSSSTPIGYLQTLQRQEQLINDTRNEQQLAELGERYTNLAKGGTLSKLQVDQIEQQRLNARSRVLTDEVQLGDALDQFKIQLGIPTNTLLELDRSPVEPLRSKLDELDQVYSTYRHVLDELDQRTNDPANALKVRELLLQALQNSYVARNTKARDDLLQRWARWRRLQLASGAGTQEVADFAGLAASGLTGGLLPLPTTAAGRLAEIGGAVRRTEERTLSIQARISAYTKDERAVPPELEKELVDATLEQEVAEMESALQVLESRPWEDDDDPNERRKEIEQRFRVVRNKFALVIENARIERLEWIFERWPELPKVLLNGRDLLGGDPEEAQFLAEEAAIANRLDLMNQRAAVVDAWRQIAVDANGLLGVVNLNYHLDVLTTAPLKASKPLDFEGRRSNHELTVETRLPLVRLNERNLYRASLIAYQRQRRSLMQQEDRVRFDVRQELRQLRQFMLNYDVQKLAVELAYQQIDNALETLQAPPDPGVQRDAATAAAALTQQIINAQGSLPLAQNQLFSAWVNYLTTRMRLYRDLELLRVDARGVWIDEFASPDPNVQRPAEPSQ